MSTCVGFLQKHNDIKIICKTNNFVCLYRPVALRLQSLQPLKWSNWTPVSLFYLNSHLHFINIENFVVNQNKAKGQSVIQTLNNSSPGTLKPKDYKGPHAATIHYSYLFSLMHELLTTAQFCFNPGKS